MMNELENVRLFTWNIRHGGKDISRIIKSILFHAPTTVVLTEFRIGKESALRERLENAGFRCQRRYNRRQQ